MKYTYKAQVTSVSSTTPNSSTVHISAETAMSPKLRVEFDIPGLQDNRDGVPNYGDQIVVTIES